MKPLRLSFIVVFWALIVAGSIYFFMRDVFPYTTGYRSKTFGNSFFNNQFWIVLHLVGGTMALVLGPAQFWPFIRKKFLPVHRLAGKMYMLGIALIGLSAFWLAPISTCAPCRISMPLVAFIAVLSTWFAWKAIRARNIKTHRQMMVRSYICVFAFVAVRLDNLLPLDFLFGPIEDKTFRRVVNEYFFSFVPLLIAEVIMVWWPSVAYTFRKKATVV